MNEPSGLRRARRIARLMDASIGVPFTRFRFGLDALVGLVPGLGDAIGAAVSAYILGVAVQLGVARSTLLEMLWNIAVEAIGGTIPALGDLFDAAWRSNVRNVALIERDLGLPNAPLPAGRWLVVGVGVAVVLLVVVGVWLSLRVVGWLVAGISVATPVTGG